MCFCCSAGRYVRSNLNMLPRQERLWHGRSHHCVWNHAGSTSGYVTSTDLNDLLHLALLFHFVYEICASPGEALLESNTVIDFVYCSPSLRCVQTAQNILKGKKSLLEKIWIWDSSTFTLWLLNFYLWYVTGVFQGPMWLRWAVMNRVCVNRSAAGQ